MKTGQEQREMFISNQLNARDRIIRDASSDSTFGLWPNIEIFFLVTYDLLYLVRSRKENVK